MIVCNMHLRIYTNEENDLFIKEYLFNFFFFNFLRTYGNRNMILENCIHALS